MTTPTIKTGIPGSRALRCFLLLVAVFAAFTMRARDNVRSLDEYSIKAALLFNIAKYTNWPASAFPHAEAPIVIGILGADPFGDVLDRLVQGRSINGRSITIRRASGIAPLAGAHLVFVSASQPQARQDCAALERSGAVTVGDSAFTTGFTAISLAVERDKIVFTVDLGRALRAGAQISSQLLRFAKTVQRAEES